MKLSEAYAICALGIFVLPGFSQADDAQPSPLPSPSGSRLMEGDEAPMDLPDLSLERLNGEALTLDGSVNLAIRAATAVLKAQNQVSASGAALLQGYGQFLPSLIAQGDLARNGGTEYLSTGTPTLVNGSTLGAGYSLSADLNIFNGLSDFSRLKAAIARKDASELTLLRAKQAISLDVSQSFLSVVLDRKLVAIARKNLEESQARQKLLLEQTRIGAKNLSDLFRQEAQTSADEALVLSTENKKRADQIALLQKLRLDVSKDYHFVDPELPPEAADARFDDENSLLRLGLATRADLKASDEAASAFHWDVKTQWAGYLPRLDLVGSVTSGGAYLYTQTISGQSVVPATQPDLLSQLGNQIEYSVGLNLSWTIFDRLVTHESVVNARVAAENADIDKVDVSNQVQAEVRLAYGNYKTALQQLRTSKKGQEAAQKAYDVIEGRYEVGAANFIDLITVQATLLQAETAYAQATIDFLLQAKGLDFATGETKVE